MSPSLTSDLPTPTIIIYPDSHNIHIGLSSNCIPTSAISTKALPFTPPITFATRFLHTVLTYLHIPASKVEQYGFAMVEPPIYFDDKQRKSIFHALKHILQLKGSIEFYSAIDSAMRIMGISSNPLMIYIYNKYIILQSIYSIDIVMIGINDVDNKLKSLLLSSNNNNSNEVQKYDIRKLRRLCGICTTGEEKEKGNNIGNVIIKNNKKNLVIGCERYEAFNVLYDECNENKNIAKQLIHVLKSVEDVYERARLAKSIILIGEAATIPGFSKKLIHHVNVEAISQKLVRKGKNMIEILKSPFAADCLLWSGAALLVDSGQPGIKVSSDHLG